MPFQHNACTKKITRGILLLFCIVSFSACSNSNQDTGSGILLTNSNSISGNIQTTSGTLINHSNTTISTESKNRNENIEVALPPIELYEVVKVVDGDTLDIIVGNSINRVRLIGIDTPETVDPRKPVQCFGKEASDKAKSLLLGKKVTVREDASQGDKDKYNRLLRYVFLEDGTFANKHLIEEGYAFEYTYDFPYIYQSEFKEAQTQAKGRNKGLWNSSTCNGKVEIVADPLPIVTPNPTSSINTVPDRAPSQPVQKSVPTAVVKLSRTGICHAPGTTYYSRTTNFTAYDTLSECLQVGRLPKR